MGCNWGLLKFWGYEEEAAEEEDGGGRGGGAEAIEVSGALYPTQFWLYWALCWGGCGCGGGWGGGASGFWFGGGANEICGGNGLYEAMTNFERDHRVKIQISNSGFSWISFKNQSKP